MEIESQEEGYLAKIFSSGKEDVPVGAPLAIICQEEDQVCVFCI